MGQQTFENTVRKVAERTAASASITIDFNDYNGWCIKTASSDNIYLVMNGEKRLIPNMGTFNGIFASSNIHDGTSLIGSLWTRLVNEMPTGDNITDGAQLIKSDDSAAVFLLTSGRKYGITSPEQFNSCNFDWKKIHSYPAIVVNAIPAGGNTAFQRA